MHPRASVIIALVARDVDVVRARRVSVNGRRSRLAHGLALASELKHT